MARLIKADGVEIELVPADGKVFTLEELHLAVGGYIQLVEFPNGTVLCCNEEGKLQPGMRPNYGATKIWVEHYGPTDVIFGDVVIGTPQEMGNEDVDIREGE